MKHFVIFFPEKLQCQKHDENSYQSGDIDNESEMSAYLLLMSVNSIHKK